MPLIIFGEVWSDSLLAAVALNNLQRQLSRLERRVAQLQRRRKAEQRIDALPKLTRQWSPGRTARLSRRARRRLQA
jgi:Tfp pilus assembly protein PilO